MRINKARENPETDSLKKEDPVPSRPTAEELADGKILLQLKHNFLEDRRAENFVQIVCCLRDSTVTVPMHVEIPEELKGKITQEILEGKEESEYREDLKYFPMTVTNDAEEVSMAVFSNEEEIRGFYSQGEDCVFEEISMLDCIEFFNGLDDCEQIVLDPFTEPLIITKDLASLIATIKYKDESDS